MKGLRKVVCLPSKAVEFIQYVNVEEIKHERCPTCNCWRTPNEFLNKNCRRVKVCLKCRNLATKHRLKLKNKLLATVPVPL